MYQYKIGGGEWQIIDADSYTQDERKEDELVLVSIEAWTSHEVNHLCRVHYRFKHLYNPDTIKVGSGTRENWRWIINAPRSYDPLNLSTLAIRFTNGFEVICQTESGTIITGLAQDGGAYSSVNPLHPGCQGQGGYSTESNSLIQDSVSIDKTELRHIVREPAGCDTRFYKNGEVIKAILGLRECPVIEKLNQCPENTCRVDCGTHYCCYNSEGISTFSYLK